jgi:hypothetical protein
MQFKPKKSKYLRDSTLAGGGRCVATLTLPVSKIGSDADAVLMVIDFGPAIAAPSDRSHVDP